MAKIDMHVHSKYSEHPSEWFLQRLGAKESYTEPEFIYQTAKKRGMNFVTITDHNRIEGALRLKDRYPDDVIVGVESTTYFPDNGCKIHILLYGIDEKQFEQIQELRKDIFTFREYIRAENLAYSVAHATFSVNKKLTREHIEKLILLFDVFEGINGGRNYQSNIHCMDILKQLTPAHLERLQEQYQIEPLDKSSWKKSFTAGSDDHSGLFVGQTYTLSEGAAVKDVLDNIKHKNSAPMGRHNDYKSLAFTVYKIAYDFSRSQQKVLTGSFAGRLTENIFESKPFDLKHKLQFYRLKTKKRKDQNRIPVLLVELIDEIKKIKPTDLDNRLEIVYSKTAEIADEYFRKVLDSLKKELASGDLVNFIMNLSSSIPGIFLSLPFFTAIKHMFHSRHLVEELRTSLNILPENQSKKILWFTDTIDDSNIISQNLRQVAWRSFRNGNRIRIVTSMAPDKKASDIPPNLIFIPSIFQTDLPGNKNITLHFPSILKSLQIINIEEPTEIYISTPGPIGLLGLMFSRLLNVSCTGIYHTDWTLAFSSISQDDSLTQLMKNYSRWFYSLMDAIKVNSSSNMDLLESQGLNRSKMEVLEQIA
jgi:predicted metal-dependent phosphoesterase TrpH